MFLLGRIGEMFINKDSIFHNLTLDRSADQSEGDRTVGVDPTVITACT